MVDLRIQRSKIKVHLVLFTSDTRAAPVRVLTYLANWNRFLLPGLERRKKGREEGEKREGKMFSLAVFNPYVLRSLWKIKYMLRRGLFEYKYDWK